MLPEPVLTLTIPEFLTRVCISQKRQKKYYKRGSAMSATLTKKVNAGLFYFDKDGWLRNKETDERLVSNPRAAGTPKYETLAGNQFSSGNYPPHLRATLVEALKEDYRSKLPFLTPIGADDFPLKVEWGFFAPIGVGNYDLSNLWFYYKYFEDTLVNLGVFPDDSIRYITKPPAPQFIPVETFEERKFIFKFYRDERPVVRNHPFWRNK